MNEPFEPPHRSWTRKFRDAFHGIGAGVQGQSSFRVHLGAAAAVILAGALLRIDWIEWSLLLGCITIVLTAELFNSALEELACAIDQAFNPHLERGLNIASGAVLTAALGASAIGIIVLGRRLLLLVFASV